MKGVMTAASFWSLLAPAIETAELLEYGSLSFIPSLVGFALGAGLIAAIDACIACMNKAPNEEIENEETADQDLALKKTRADSSTLRENDANYDELAIENESSVDGIVKRNVSMMGVGDIETETAKSVSKVESDTKILSDNRPRMSEIKESFHNTMLLVLAVTLHNLPEGLAVGVGFGAIGFVPSATLETAQLLAFGIGVQNFPEGLAVALPLRRLGMPKWKCFALGQLSGVVEPIGGLLGSALVTSMLPILPYALALAAGAMIYVVFHAIIPESHKYGNAKLSTKGAILGFLIMMSLDVALG